MNKNAMGLIFLSSILAACAPSPKAVPACQASSTPPPCDRGQPPHVTLTPGRVQAAPPRYCVAAGGTVMFQVAGSPAKSSVATVPEDPFEIWLYGSNTADAKEFSVQVPAKQPLGDYKYKVFFGNGKCLDPMIQVTN